MTEKTLAEIAEHIQAAFVGDGDIVITRAATLENSGPGDITFLSNKKYLPQVATTAASAVVVDRQIKSSAALLIAEDPYYAFMQIVVLLHGHRKHPDVGIGASANIAPSARLGKNCNIHSFATVSDNAVIGDNCHIYPGVFIGPDVRIGDNCIFYPNAVIYDKTIVGNRVIIHSNASVAQDGYGFATHNGAHHKIPQIGRVIIEDDVELGAGCAIERGTLDDTVIGEGSKIGDLVAIGHGTKIGPHCLLVPQVAVAGSATLGHHCVLGGQAGVVGHIKIGNMVRIAAQAGVINDVPDGATLLGSPAVDAGKGRRAYGLIETIPDLRTQIRKLQKRLDKLDKLDKLSE
jgi:UDP-3-O-[3-hydroxymyristoyl] glucosamine N-acyltransferase